MDILNQFGVDPKLLAAQVVNFLLLLFILQRFLYKPILKVLKQRQDTIANSLKNAEKIEQRLEQTEADREKTLEQASLEAQKIINEATQASNQLIAQARDEATKQMEQILAQAREQIKLDQAKMQQEIREELADLVVIGIEKVAGKVLTSKDQKEIIRKSLKDLN
jgi:F-type H+-transporting ATPase subunit b